MSARRGVLLVNVGTPDDPSVPSVRRYLAEFLNDPRVIDLPTPARWLLLNAVILPFRPKKSAHAYRQIWTEQGSPLLINARAQADALQALMPEVVVRLGMRYGNPSLSSVLREFTELGVTDITVVPMYPQHARASTVTALDKWRELGASDEKVIPAFHAMPGFIEASAANIKQTVARIDAQYVLFSYHGLPVHQHHGLSKPGCAKQEGECPALDGENANCYRAQCFTTTRALVAAAGVTKFSTAFQSRLKGQKWIRPFTDEVLVKLAQDGVKRLAVACPSFVADCLETLEEIGMRAEASFREAGGETLALVPAVNAHPVFMRGLADEVLRVTSRPSGHAHR
ncbi:MAG: ferrochelatase [Archangium sp.]